MADKKPDARITIELAEGDIQPIDAHLGAADTLPLRGIDLLTRIRGIARAQIGRKERGGKNWGDVVIDAATPLLSPERLARFAPGGPNEGDLEWCGLFVGDCVLQGLEADGRPPEQLREWRRLASAEVPVFRDRLAAAGLFVPHVPGQPPPANAIAAFFRRFAHVEIFDQVLGQLAVTIGGNTGPKSNEVAEHRTMLDDPKLDGWGLLPW